MHVKTGDEVLVITGKDKGKRGKIKQAMPKDQRVVVEGLNIIKRHMKQRGPGKPSGMYHAESDQEDFLVLAGTCLLIVEEEERQLSAWDFVHCPPGTRHTFVGTGDGQCVIFMTGARTADGTIVYPVSETARAHGAGVEIETPSPREAYAPFGHWRLGRPAAWVELPWS